MTPRGSRTQQESRSLAVAAVTWDRIRSEVALRLRRGQRVKAEDLAAATARALADVARAHGIDPADGPRVTSARGVVGGFFRGSSTGGGG